MSKIINSLYYLIVLCFFFCFKIANAGLCVSLIANNCEYAGNKDTPYCKGSTVSKVNVTIDSTLGLSYDWNNLLKKTIAPTNLDASREEKWKIISENTMTKNGIEIYNPKLLWISDVSGMSNAVYPAGLNMQNLTENQQELYSKIINNPKNLFIHSFNSKGGIYVTTYNAPVLDKVLNYAYENNSLYGNNIFSVIGQSEHIPIYSLDSGENNPMNFGKCVDKDNKSCLITLRKNDEKISFNLNYSIDKDKYFSPIKLKKEPTSSDNIGAELSLVASCFINYVNNNCPSIIGKDIINRPQNTNPNCNYNPTATGCKTSELTGDYKSCVTSFFSNNVSTCLESYLNVTEPQKNIKIDPASISLTSCKEKFTTLRIVNNYMTNNNKLSGTSLYTNIRSGSLLGCKYYYDTEKACEQNK